MTPEEELKALKAALWNWSNSKTYEEGCRNWRKLCELIGFDPATNQSIPRNGAPESDEAAA